jgi:hypothetical protein
MGRKNNSMQPKHPWFRRKRYLHFDFSLERKKAEIYVRNPENILRHRFSPLIHYKKITRKIHRNKLAERRYRASGRIGDKPRFEMKKKIRNIFYTSHVDGYIYCYYSYMLQKYYENFLAKNGLISNVIAYRSIAKDGVRFSNIHFAHDVFDLIVETNGCHILCFDISKFFDTLSIDVLKKKWAQVLGKDKLPDDHFKVYESLVYFRYVEEKQLIRGFKKRFKKNPRQHAFDWASGGSQKNRICSYPELRALKRKLAVQGECLIKKKDILEITGIPQGTAISGLLSNIFMIDFDMAMKQYVGGIGGYYRRYSDDICIIVPTTIDFSQVENHVQQQLEKKCASSIKLNHEKTEKKIFKSTQSETLILDGLNNQPSMIQYLGFNFNGKNTFIRDSSISKHRGKIVQLIRWHHKKGTMWINTLQVFKRLSPRKITPYDEYNRKGFVYYAKRAAYVHGNSETISAQIRKNDPFIKKAIRRERLRKSKSYR